MTSAPTPKPLECGEGLAPGQDLLAILAFISAE